MQFSTAAAAQAVHVPTPNYSTKYLQLILWKFFFSIYFFRKESGSIRVYARIRIRRWKCEGIRIMGFYAHINWKALRFAFAMMRWKYHAIFVERFFFVFHGCRRWMNAKRFSVLFCSIHNSERMCISVACAMLNS